MNERDSVYIVTQGVYSDYKIVAVFATVQEAVAFIGEGSDAADVRIEHWLIGDTENLRYQKTWTVRIELETGNLTEWGDDETIQLHPPEWSSGDAYPSFGVNGVAIGQSVISREHALKVAAEARQAYLRERTLGVATHEAVAGNWEV